MQSTHDEGYMRAALQLAKAQLGRTAPNPSVGALIVKNKTIIGQGVTARGGRPHAETIALQQAGSKARGATLYVTLEPCNHQGKTPPCVDAIIAAGITRVVVACEDPNPRVAGKGIAALEAAGIEVTLGVCEQEALTLNEGFFTVINHRRPFVTLKLATSLDGKIATADGESQWITCEESRMRGHLMRAEHDAILTSIGTVLSDDPRLTCRAPGREDDSPIRILVDRCLRVPPHAKLLPAWIMTSKEAMHDHTLKMNALEASGSKVFALPTKNGHISLPELLRLLGKEGVTRLMVEAGSSLSSAFAREGLIDRLYWFRAPIVLGENGIPALKGQDVPLARAKRYQLQSVERIGTDDLLEIYNCKVQ